MRTYLNTRVRLIIEGRHATSQLTCLVIAARLDSAREVRIHVADWTALENVASRR